MLCHRTKVAKDFWCCSTDSAFSNVIGREKFLPRKLSMLMKAEGLAECHQTLSSCGWGLGTKLGRWSHIGGRNFSILAEVFISTFLECT